MLLQSFMLLDNYKLQEAYDMLPVMAFYLITSLLIEETFVKKNN